MSQALVISDNEIINDVYTLNLQVYTATNVTVKKNLDEAIKLLELSPNYDLIVALTKIGQDDVGKKLGEFLKKNKVEIPLILVGEGSTALKQQDVVLIKGLFDLPQLIKAVAKFLEITAQDMMKLPVPAFYPIPLSMFKNQKKLICDVYFRINKQDEKEYIMVWEKASSVDDKFNSYLKEGVKNLYIPADFRLKFINSTTQGILANLNDPNATAGEKVQAVEQAFELTADQLFNNEEVSLEMAEISKSCVAAISSVIKDAPKLKGLLASLLANKSSFIYLHSVMTTYVGTHIVRNVSWGGESHVDKVSFVLFFHDIYLVPIYNKYPHLKYEDELLRESELTDQEKNLVLKHARLAGEMVKDLPRAPLGADTIITQHHGMTNGEGFAMDFKDDISPLAKVVVIAESFVDELLKQRDSTGKQDYDLAAILAILNKRYRRSSYRKIVNTLENINI